MQKVLLAASVAAFTALFASNPFSACAPFACGGIRLISTAAAQTAQEQTYKLGALTITAPWTRVTPKGAKVAGGYVRITNTGKEADRLVGGSFDLSARVEVHEMAVEGGVMRMRELTKGLRSSPARRSS